MLNSTYNCVPSDAFHNSSHVTKNRLLIKNNELNINEMTCLYPNFSEAKDHPQQHKIIHSNTLTTSKDIISFLVDEGTSAYQVSCCSQKSQSRGTIHLSYRIIFQERRMKTFRQLISKVNDEHCLLQTALGSHSTDQCPTTENRMSWLSCCSVILQSL